MEEGGTTRCLFHTGQTHVVLPPAVFLRRLAARLRAALVRPKRRKATKPTRGSNERRLTAKKSRVGVKSGRQERSQDD